MVAWHLKRLLVKCSGLWSEHGRACAPLARCSILQASRGCKVRKYAYTP